MKPLKLVPNRDQRDVWNRGPQRVNRLTPDTCEEESWLIFKWIQKIWRKSFSSTVLVDVFGDEDPMEVDVPVKVVFGVDIGFHRCWADVFGDEDTMEVDEATKSFSMLRWWA